MKIEILGIGCPKCKTFTANTEKAAQECGITAEIIKVSKIEEIAAYGVMMTPALVVDGTVKSVGKVLSVEEIKKLLC